MLKLLAKGAEVDCEDMDGDTPLMLAAANNNTGELKLPERENVDNLLKVEIALSIQGFKPKCYLNSTKIQNRVSVVSKLSKGCRTKMLSNGLI